MFIYISRKNVEIKTVYYHFRRMFIIFKGGRTERMKKIVTGYVSILKNSSHEKQRKSYAGDLIITVFIVADFRR